MYALVFAALIGQPQSMLPGRDSPYADAYADASKTGKPFVVFVNAKVRSVPGCVTAYVDSNNGNDEPRVIVCRDVASKGDVLDAGATVADIRRAAGLEVSQQSARPFNRFGEEPRTADDKPWLPSSEQQRLKALWPNGVPMPDDLAFYSPAQHVQRSAVTDFPQEGRINVLTVDWLPRRSQSPYDVPGGLDRIPRSQWSAHPAVSKSVTPKVFERIDPFATAYGGRLRRFDRTFAADATFYDLLVNSRGEVFELRAMDYQGGKEPEPMVLFADSSKSPSGYSRVKSSACLSCHADAGSVKYATGNVVGGGHNFSFPFE